MICLCVSVSRPSIGNTAEENIDRILDYMKPTIYCKGLLLNKKIKLIKYDEYYEQGRLGVRKQIY